MPQPARLKEEVGDPSSRPRSLRQTAAWHEWRDDAPGLGERLLDLLFPARCVNCKQVKGALCASCLAGIQPITTPTCERCGHPLDSARAVCPQCRIRPLTITRIQSAVWHEGALREAIHALKYNHRRDVARPLAQFASALVAQTELRYDFVTSVPLHLTREQERGYNQAELLAEQVARMSHLPYARVLQRTRATADQIGLDAKARRVNVANAFQADPLQVANKIVLVIDDVSTTGATLDACAVALFLARASAVYGVTIARPRAHFH